MKYTRTLYVVLDIRFYFGRTNYSETLLRMLRNAEMN